MMDFLDPKKSRAQQIRLLLGYLLIGIAVVMATYLLMYLASGFGYKQGKIIQNGLVFVSSAPGGAQIYTNGQSRGDVTNARLVMPAGTYSLKLTRDGYRDWQRALTVEGGSVEHFDYPLLIPKQLAPAAVSGYQLAPTIATESPDRRWLVVQPSGGITNFDVYDLRDPKQVLANKTSISVPSSIYTLAQKDGQTLTLEEWSRDNDHILLRHTVDSQSELVMVSRTKPDSSFNITKRLQLTATMQVSLLDKKFDRYFVHDTSAQTLATATYDQPTLVKLLTGVIQYKTYGQDVVVYTSASGADTGKVAVKLYQDKKTYTLRQIAQSSKYLLDITTYDNDWFIVSGSTPEEHVYVYKNPAQQLQDVPGQPVVPVGILHLRDPNYVEFSANSQNILAENGQDFATYDVYNDRSYTYHSDKLLDAPQNHVTWMDGHRLTWLSGSSVAIMDYDGTNTQSLSAGISTYLPFFDTDYRTLYAIAPAGNGAVASSTASSLFATPLRTPADQ